LLDLRLLRIRLSGAQAPAQMITCGGFRGPSATLTAYAAGTRFSAVAFFAGDAVDIFAGSKKPADSAGLSIRTFW
jgi:hypothetical protein